ncbi:hypothetical protein MOQ72_42235 [Saccharopolyspora sp. K220]|uniref:hypothetical protein n=1 Tax=Saccharopolyspora soli TaxID=2926618 RepID=UPI001F577F06|nr:hypothetical protein [Saccharopolyspora soli]MCI2424038.1 hypothetical protein [Saccharopolyspora soli]
MSGLSSVAEYILERADDAALDAIAEATHSRSRVLTQKAAADVRPGACVKTRHLTEDIPKASSTSTRPAAQTGSNYRQS